MSIARDPELRLSGPTLSNACCEGSDCGDLDTLRRFEEFSEPESRLLGVDIEPDDSGSELAGRNPLDTVGDRID
jgi:hypothetical protein